jgi:hypothetical protein
MRNEAPSTSTDSGMMIPAYRHRKAKGQKSKSMDGQRLRAVSQQGGRATLSPQKTTASDQSEPGLVADGVCRCSVVVRSVSSEVPSSGRATSSYITAVSEKPIRRGVSPNHS